MNIEKLGFEKIDISWFNDIDHVLLQEVRKVEIERNGLLRISIEAVLMIEQSREFVHIESVEYSFRNTTIDFIETISGKPWEEIKELIK